MNQDKCTIEVNGVTLEARPGQMLIEVTDAAGIYIPRFCYHSKLSIAANCRMCLVEVEKAPKPMPACATPVTPGMKVSTKSPKAIGSQKAVMEFLLINHPLDCPICDQGGECELQDLAMGFGRDVARYSERKRVVRDKNIGPLVSTDMTRCIHCTRCVRFTQEVAGYQELGTIGRGDRVQISPYIERVISHELSGNIIDLCPVGALNSKPFRFSARAWEMTQHATVSPHDCFGSQLHVHVMDGRVKRVVPRPCESLNETWLSDRDRFSYEGIYSADRLEQPMLREGGSWRPASWDEALDVVASGLAKAPTSGALVSPSATVEEGYLLAGIMDKLGSANVDYRLRRRDFSAQDVEPHRPTLGLAIADIEALDQILIIGSNLRAEVPLLAHRVRKAALRGAAVHFINPACFPYLFPVASYAQGSPGDFWREIESLVRAGRDPSGAAEERHRLLFSALRGSGRSAILIGQLSQGHPAFGEIFRCADELARLTNSSLGLVSEGANAAGLAEAGVLPHYGPAGSRRSRPGLTAAGMIDAPPEALVLFGIEPDSDLASGMHAIEVMARVPFVAAFSPYFSESLQRTAHVILPIGTFAETDGTFVNGEGRWQSFGAVARLVGLARPGWKVLRVLGNRLGINQWQYARADEIAHELQSRLDQTSATAAARSIEPSPTAPGHDAVTLADLDVGAYRIDALVRRAPSLQELREGPAAVDVARCSA
jgi:NADH-quinone oxidoreductase subunit G